MRQDSKFEFARPAVKPIINCFICGDSLVLRGQPLKRVLCEIPKIYIKSLCNVVSRLLKVHEIPGLSVVNVRRRRQGTIYI